MNLKPLLRPALAAALLGVAALPIPAAGALNFPTTSKLATEGRWVKITCDKPGMQQITYDKLREWGFSDPSKVRVFGYSTSRMFVKNGLYGDFTTPGLPTDLKVMKTLRWPESSPSKLVFYNEGQFAHSTTMTSVSTYVNYYDTTNSYLLTDARTDNDAIETSGYLSGRNNSVTYHRSLEYVRDMTTNPRSGGALYFGTPWTTETNEVTLTMTDPTTGLSDTYASTLFFNVSFSAISDVNGNLNASATLNDTEMMTQLSVTELAAPAQATAIAMTEHDGYTKFKVNAGAPNLLPATFTINRTNDKSKKAKTVYPRYYALSYMRDNILRPETGQMTMYFDFITVKNSTIQFKGEALPLGETAATASTTPLKLSKELYVWDVSYPLLPLNLEKQRISTTDNDASTWAVTIPAHTLDDATYGARISGYPLVAFRPSTTLHEPVYAGEVKSQNLHGMAQCDMLIITTETLRPQAERLARAHEEIQGLKVNVVTHDEVLNEFTAGTRHAMAYRLLSKMLYDRNAKSTGAQYRYLLLMGPAVWDNIHTILPKGEYLLSYETPLYNYANMSGRNFASNDYFGDVDDDVNEYNLPSRASSVAVGHIDAYDLDEARRAVDKTINYLKNPPFDSDALTRALYQCDSGVTFRNDAVANSDRAVNFQNSLTTERLFLDLASDKSNGDTSLRDLVAEALAEGRYYWNYTGHANATEFRSSKCVWNSGLAANLKYNLPPIAMFGTCDTYVFDQMDGGIVHQMMMNEHGGVIAAVAACRSVYHTQNNYMARGFERAMFDRPAERGLATVGDLYVRAKANALTETSNLGATLYGNTRCYNLVGDPAVPLYVPSSHVLVSELSGNAVTSNPNKQADASVSVVPDKPFTIKGFVAADSTSTAVTADFNGTVYISIYDRPRSERTVYGSNAAYITTDHVPLLRTAAKVTNGVFETTVTLPAGSGGSASLPSDAGGIGEYNRMTLLAVRDGAAEIASGASRALALQPYDESQAITDAQAPVIEEAYINTADFTDGMTVAPSPTLYVQATDEGLGFSTGYASGTQALEVSVDGKPCTDDVATLMRPGADGAITLALPLGDLTPGEHSVTITATDRAGNMSTRMLTFSIAGAVIEASIAVAESPAREQATLTIATAEALATPQVTVVIRNAAGATVRTITGTSTECVWDLTDNTGSPVADGTYTAFAQLTDGSATGSTAPLQVIVVR